MQHLYLADGELSDKREGDAVCVRFGRDRRRRLVLKGGFLVWVEAVGGVLAVADPCEETDADVWRLLGKRCVGSCGRLGI